MVVVSFVNLTRPLMFTAFANLRGNGKNCPTITFLLCAKQKQTRHTDTHTYTHVQRLHLPAVQTERQQRGTCLTGCLGQRNGWVAGGGGRFRRRDGGVRRAFKKHLLKAAYVTLGEITHASTVLDYGINNVG